MGKDKFKVSETDRASIAASSFNAAALLVSQDDTALDEAADAVLDLTDYLFDARIKWMKANKIGNAPKPSSGGGGSYKPSGGSSGSSGGSNTSGDPATLKQVGFYGDLIDALEELESEAKYTVKEVKKMTKGDASEAIEKAKDKRDKLQG